MGFRASPSSRHRVWHHGAVLRTLLIPGWAGHLCSTRRSTEATLRTVQGVTLQLTQGVTKNIIPAIASTNAFVAAICALETLKIVTLCSKGMDNYLMCVGT